jgi:hypothetical protein
MGYKKITQADVLMVFSIFTIGLTPTTAIEK